MPRHPTGWRVNVWVKQGILLGFRFGDIVDMGDRQGTLAVLRQGHAAAEAARRREPASASCPGGSSIRDGAYLGPGRHLHAADVHQHRRVRRRGTLVDSHALVGSCAQIGERVHLSAAAQIGGVIEPVGAMPVIVEDDVLVGGNCGVYEGAIIKRRAVLASGTIITGSTPVYDLPNGRIIKPRAGATAGRSRGRRGRARRARGHRRRRHASGACRSRRRSS